MSKNTNNNNDINNSNINSQKFEENKNEVDNLNNNINNLPTSDYLKMTVEKELIEGLFLLSQEQPSNPIEYLGNFLINKSKEKSKENK